VGSASAPNVTLVDAAAVGAVVCGQVHVCAPVRVPLPLP
jgi:hypothetical protein